MNQCDIARDLLPLYKDNVVSASSVAMIEEHLKACENCGAELVKLQSEIKVSLNPARKEEVGAFRRFKKKLRRRTILTACASTVLGVVLILGLYIHLFDNATVIPSAETLTARQYMDELFAIYEMAGQEAGQAYSIIDSRINRFEKVGEYAGNTSFDLNHTVSVWRLEFDYKPKDAAAVSNLPNVKVEKGWVVSSGFNKSYLVFDDVNGRVDLRCQIPMSYGTRYDLSIPENFETMVYDFEHGTHHPEYQIKIAPLYGYISDFSLPNARFILTQDVERYAAMYDEPGYHQQRTPLKILSEGLLNGPGAGTIRHSAKTIIGFNDATEFEIIDRTAEGAARREIVGADEFERFLTEQKSLGNHPLFLIEWPDRIAWPEAYTDKDIYRDYTLRVIEQDAP